MCFSISLSLSLSLTSNWYPYTDWSIHRHYHTLLDTAVRELPRQGGGSALRRLREERRLSCQGQGGRSPAGNVVVVVLVVQLLLWLIPLLLLLLRLLHTQIALLLLWLRLMLICLLHDLTKALTTEITRKGEGWILRQKVFHLGNVLSRLVRCCKWKLMMGRRCWKLQ